MTGRLSLLVVLLLLVAVCGVFTSGPAHASTARIVGSTAAPDGLGWWTVDAAGAVTPGGDAVSYGDMDGRSLNQPIVGMASTADGRGYWLVASDGGIFSFGDAGFYGSTGSLRLNQPIVGMASTADGRGYWLVASDGGIFSFGDAGFYGSTGSLRLNQPIVGMASTADGRGYWLVASDGGIFSFGDAAYHGSTGSMHLSTPMVDMAATRDGQGYWMVTSGGQVYSFGDAGVQGQPGTTSFGIMATAGGGYSVLTTNGPEHYGPAISSASTAAPAPTAASPTPTAAPAAVAPTPTPTTPAPAPASATPSVPSSSSPSLSSGIASALQTVTSGAGSTGLVSTDGTATEPQVVREGSTLREVNPANASQYLGGDFTFAGVDAYELNTDWTFNEGCGTDVSIGQIDQLFSSLGPGTVVRVWFFQQFAIQQYGGPWDFAPMDRLIAAADQYGVHLIATLGNQDGTCDDGVWKDPSWYTTGWKTLDKNSGDNQVSFQQWVQMVVSRYASNPAILAWEPINEPRPDTCTLAAGTPGWGCWNDRVCPDEIAARDAVRGFFDQVGAEIHAIDPEALVSDGALEEPGCGWNTEADWDYVESSPGIDLVSLHDYTGTTLETPQSMAWYTDEIANIGKPVFAGEDGDNDSTPTCSDYQTEISNWQTKVQAEFDHYGLVGWLWWNWSPSNPPVAASICAPSTDPLLTMIQSLKQA